MDQTRRLARGITLVEVATVLAILGLLFALLGPAFPKAREQSQEAICLANLRFISQSAASYMGEHGTIVFAFPFGYTIDGDYPRFSFATEFIWGGGVPDKRWADWDTRWGSFNPAQLWTDTYCIRPIDRPLNDYMVPGVWWDHPDRIKGNPERYLIPMELPDFFKCPSDSSPVIPMAGAGDPNMPPDPNNPTWAWWGTSYAINWYWGYYYSTGSLIGSVDDPGILDGPLHQEIIRSKQDHGASEWILFHENRLNYAFEGARPRGVGIDEPRSLIGWHDNENTHAAGFADGSARYRRFESQYVNDLGWTLWPNQPWDGAP
jgi:type II secretory pathway pseudopilin PulG